MRRVFFIYKLTTPSGKVYIGQTISINRRFSSYRNNPSKSQSLIYSSIKKYGWNSIKKEIIYDGLKTQKECDILETELISKYTDLGISLNIVKNVETPFFKTGSSHHRSKTVLRISLDFKTIIEYVNGSQASKDLNLIQSCISWACRSDYPLYSGYYWRFKEVYNIDDLKKILNKPHFLSTPIYQLDKQLNIIKLWDSQTNASLELGFNQANIYRSLSGKNKTAYGFVWAYKEDFDKSEISYNEYKKRGKQINVLNLEGELLYTFPTITKASIELSVDRSTIMRCLKNKIKKPKKYLYEYV